MQHASTRKTVPYFNSMMLKADKIPTSCTSCSFPLPLHTFPQDDIQIVINQQLRTQQQSELPLKKPAPNGISFFRRPSRTPPTWTRQSSTSSSSYGPDPIQDKSQSPWRDWLRRGKGLQSGKWWTVNTHPSPSCQGKKSSAEIVGQIFRRHAQCKEALKTP